MFKGFSGFFARVIQHEVDHLDGIDEIRFKADLDRLKAVTPADIRRVVGQYLLGPRAIVGVVPEGQLEKGAVRRDVTP